MPTLPQLLEEDIRELNRCLRELLVKSEANTALVIDKGGFVITHVGEGENFDMVTLGALSAASFAATEGIAGLVSERNFSSVYQQGEAFSLLVNNVDQYCLLTLIFAATTSVGAVKYFAADTIKQVARQMSAAHCRAPDEGLDLSMLNVADTAPFFRRK